MTRTNKVILSLAHMREIRKQQAKRARAEIELVTRSALYNQEENKDLKGNNVDRQNTTEIHFCFAFASPSIEQYFLEALRLRSRS